MPDGLARLFMAQEACASVALSHDEGCDCTACRAADGDREALVQVMAMIEATDREEQG
jgi:hypothetical protein